MTSLNLYANVFSCFFFLGESPVGLRRVHDPSEGREPGAVRSAPDPHGLAG